MVKKCIYCSCILEEESVVDICTTCGHNVWGEKMFGTILKNMGEAREKGDLYQGSVS
jgi:rRNA maturation endonuclease Nob1